jgi:hypothetical protein
MKYGRDASPFASFSVMQKECGTAGTTVPAIAQKGRSEKYRTALLKLIGALVATATAITTVTATTIATVSTATTTAAATATAAITATTTAAAAATTTAAFTRFHGTSFVDGQRTAVDLLAMKLRNGRLSFLSGSHFDEAEATGTSRHAVVDHLHPRDVARLGKQIGQVIFGHAKGQIAHVQFNAHFSSLMAR